MSEKPYKLLYDVNFSKGTYKSILLPKVEAEFIMKEIFRYLYEQ